MMGAPRCPDCNKFVSMEQEEPEVTLGEYEDHILQVEVRLALNCAECGGELREAHPLYQNYDTFSCPKCGNTDVELENVEGEASDRYEGKGRAQHFWGADMTATFSCPNKCENFTYMFRVEEVGSAFDDLY